MTQQDEFQKAIKKHKEIKERLKEYHKHRNDPYAYYPDEIKQVREFLDHAPEDIEFLLNVLDKILPEAIKKLINNKS